MDSLSIINHSPIPDELLTPAIRDSIQCFHSLFSSPACKTEIILCRDKREFNRLMLDYTGEDEKILNNMRDYNGNFLCPKAPTDTLRILLLPKKDMIPGARRYFEETMHGTLKTAELTDDERSARGIEIANFCHFVETLLHEYSHLCSFDSLMKATDWEDPGIGAHSMDFHLYDEFIARYRSTYAMLRMMEPYVELNLLYTLWMGYWEDTLKGFENEGQVIMDYLKNQKEGIEDDCLRHMHDHNVSENQMAQELEAELGHRLHYGGKPAKSGAPLLSPQEVVEFLMFDDFAEDEAEIADVVYRRCMPMLYYTKNPYASYQGSQLFGLTQSFYDFLLDETKDASDALKDELRTPEESLWLADMLDVPYYEQIDFDGFKQRLNRFADFFENLQNKEQGIVRGEK